MLAEVWEGGGGMFSPVSQLKSEGGVVQLVQIRGGESLRPSLLPLTTALLSHRYDLHTVTLSNRYRYAVTRPPPLLRRYELTTVSLSTVTVRPPLRLGHR